MKKHFNFFKNTILLLGGGLVLLAGLVSCENFLKGADVRKDLAEAIEVANSQAVTFNVVIEKGSGTVNLTQIRGKKNDTFELIFEPADDWKFITWEVTDKETGEVVSDIIKFNPADKPQTKCTIQNPKEGLQIHAKCIQIPTIIDVEPKGTSYANAPIVVKFNMPVEAAETDTGETLFNYDNISIKCENDDLIKDEFCCYEAPVFNEDKTELTFVPKSTIKDGIILTKYMSKYNKGVASVNVTFSDAIQITSGDTLTVIKNPSLQVSFVQNVELTPPQKKVLFITRESSLNMQNAETTFAGEKFHTKNITTKPDDVTDDDVYKELVFQNACNGTFYIYGRYVDDGSGVKSVVVEENLLFNKYGHATAVNPKQTIYSVNKNIPGICDFITVNGETRFLIKYNILSSDEGVYSINVDVKDLCNNTSNTKYEVIKKTQMEHCYLNSVSQDCKTYLLSFDDFTDSDASNYVYNGVYFPKEEFKYTLKYLNTENKEQEINVPYKDIYHGALRYEVCLEDLGFIPNSVVKMIGKDSVENTYIQDIIKFPDSKMKLLFDIKKHEEYADISYYCEDGSPISRNTIYNLYLIRKDNETGTEDILTGDARYKLEPGYTYKISINSIILDNYNLSYQMNAAESLAKVPKEKITMSYEKNEKINYLTLIMTFSPDLFNDYDMLYIEDYMAGTSNVKTLVRGQTQVSWVLENYRVYGEMGSTIYSVYGYKDNRRSEKQEITIDYVDKTDVRYDNIAPHLSHKPYGDKIDLIVTDGQSGLAEKGTLRLINEKINLDKIYELNASNSYTCSIPYYDLVPVTTEPSKIIIDIKDKANNQLIEETDILSELMDYVFDMNFAKQDNGDVKFTFVYPGLKHVHGYVFEDDENENNNCKIGFETVFDIEHDSKLQTYDYGYPPDVSYSWVYIRKRKETGDAENSLDDINDSFIKIVIYDGGNGNGLFFPPVYFYNNTPGTGKNDYIIPNGRGSNSFVIGSDAPVFVQTVATSVPLEDCINWDYKEWERYKEEHGQEILNINSTVTTQVYKIPLEEIDPGKCYVVIAHYSNNNVIMSDVMVR